MKLPIVERVFVFAVFAILYASFLVLPIMLWQEFGSTDWISIAMFHSYLFVFYPLFGLLALIAFYRPAVIFTDLYWRHIAPFGRTRFLIGFAALIALSIGISANLIGGQPRAVWELTPNIPAGAQNISTVCTETGKNCNAGPMLSTMFAVRAASRNRVGLEPFARTCTADPLIEPPEENTKLRWCFISGSKLDAKACCTLQSEFRDKASARYFDFDSAELYSGNIIGAFTPNMNNISLTGFWHAVTLPFKTFFILIIIITALLLVVWNKQVEDNYAPLMPKMERGLVTSAIVMLLWPLMEYAYAQSAGVMYGDWSPGFNLKASIVILPWAVLIAIYFLKSRGFGVVSQVSSVLGAMFAALQYDQITNMAVKWTGSGASWLQMGTLFSLFLFGLFTVCWPSKKEKLLRAQQGNEPVPKDPAAVTKTI